MLEEFLKGEPPGLSNKLRRDRMKKAIFFIGVGILLFLFAPAQAAYPDREIILVNAHAAGTNTDQCIRLISDIASKALGQPIVVLNKPGASYVIGASQVANAKPDGYTIGVASGSLFAHLVHMRKVPFDVKNDFSWIASFTEHTNGLVVKADAPWKNLEEFLDYAKKNPGKIIYCHDGYGILGHILMEYLAVKKGGIEWKFVPIIGPKQVTALLGGHVHAWSAGGIHVQYVKDKQMRFLILFDPIRSKAAPDVPSIAETSYDVGYKGTPITIFGPKGMPEPIRKKLEETYLQAMQDPSYHKLLDTLQIPRLFRNGKELADTLESGSKMFENLIKITGIKGEKEEK
jgi:tripartite-type tricarboxylate transporter receptor subunit TctC